MDPKPPLRSLTGIKPTGMPHLGNYLGMIRPAIQLTEDCEAFYFIADLHALTTQHDRQALKEHTIQVAATWLALGLDPTRTLLFRQSDVPEVTELCWYLSCVTPLGLLQRAHAFKDAVAKGREITSGTFFYPVLMAADILAYDSDVVPVGKDQKQHVEMTRDMAIAFNFHFGDTLKVPEPRIGEEVATIPGLDGEKMSKSRGNAIPLFLDPKSLKKLVLSIRTDSTPLEAPKDPESCTVFNLFRLLASPEATAELAERYRLGGFGYGHAKLALFDLLEQHFAEARDRFRRHMDHPADVEDVLDAGGRRAREVAVRTVSRVRDAVGL
ncbi:MAG: tryptophan--tRNA ligase [Deltaproteobacteria bacterium]|nr:tryptophan--tRNA ligase [Deltaproteobacteria bacterium]